MNKHNVKWWHAMLLIMVIAIGIIAAGVFLISLLPQQDSEFGNSVLERRDDAFEGRNK